MGQCYDVNGFTLSSNASVCRANGQITVVTPAATAGCTATVTIELKLPTGTTSTLRQTTLGQTLVFTDLTPGNYTVLLHDPSGVSSTPKQIKVDGTYKDLLVNSGTLCGATMSRTTTTSPAFSNDDGTIEFTIVGGTGIGTDFQIRLEDEHANVLVPTRTISRPNAANNFTYTLTKVAPTDRIPSGIKVFLIVKNIIPAGVSTCDEDEIKVGVTMPAPIYMPGSYNIAFGTVGLRAESDCKYSLGINIRRIEGTTHKVIHNGGNGCYVRQILDHFIATGRATIKVINSSDAGRVGQTDNIDYTNSTRTRGFNGWGYRTNPDYLAGDELLVTIDDGYGSVIQKQFKLDVTPTKGFSAVNASSEIGSCAGDYLKIKTAFANSEAKTYPDLLGGSSLSVTPFQWGNAYTRAAWQAGHFTYEVEKLTAPGVYTAVIPDYIDFNEIDVTSSGAGRYRVRAVSPCRPPGIYIDVNVAHTANVRFNNAFNTIEKLYGIYEGTTGFRMPMPADFYYKYTGGVNRAKLTITRVDGQTSVQVPNTSLFFETPQTETIQFPIEIPLVPKSVDPAFGVDYVGLGDLPPGQYFFELQDACGRERKQIDLTNVTSFGSGTNRPSYTVTKKCETNEISYTLGNTAPNRNTMHVALERKDSLGYWRLVAINHFSSAGVFTNLPAGTYRLRSYNYYYVNLATPPSNREFIWTVMPPFAKSPLTGRATANNPYALEGVRGYSPEIVIQPRTFQPYVSGISCGSTNGSGMVLVDLSLSDLPDEDITYTLYEELAGGGRNISQSVTVSPTVVTYSFQNLNNGRYSVDIQNSCGVRTTQIIEIDSDVVLKLPTIEASQGVCPGAMAHLKLDVSPMLFDIEWYRVNPVTGALDGPLATGQMHSEIVNTQTVYQVNVALKSSFGCASGNTITQTATVTMINDVTPPTVTFFPDDQTLTLPSGSCTVAVNWQQPTATDDACSVTITSSHVAPLDLPEGIHTVTYTFTDSSGNSLQRNLIFTITPSNLDASLSGQYTDGTNPITELLADQLFYYEVSYANIGQEVINSAVLTVQLPNNANVAPAATPVDLSGAGVGATESYNAGNKTYTITIPNFLPTGGIVRIPLQLSGGQAQAAKPCMNLQDFSATMTYRGGGTNCLRTKTVATASSIEINTSTYTHSVQDCAGQALVAESGFTTYVWYQGTNVLTGVTGNVYTPTASGQYRVEKTILCGTKNVTSYETFNYTSPVEITNVTLVRAKVTCANQAQLKAQSTNGVAPYRYMARIHTDTFPVVADFTTPNATDVVTAFGDDTLNVPVGIYKVYVLDSNNCVKEYTTSVFTITQALEPAITDVKVDVCNPSGGMFSAEVSITFGEPTSSHSYTLNAGAPMPITTSPFTINNLPVGTHTLAVTDADGCGVTHTFTINQEVVLGTASLTQSLSCATPTAQITLSGISGGTGTYTYELVQVIDRATNQFAVVVSATTTMASVTETVSAVGEYEFRVWDSATLSCNPKISNPVVVNSAELPQIDVARTKVTPASCFGQPEGSIELWTLPANLAPFQFRITQIRDLATGATTAVNIAPTTTLPNSAIFTALVGTAMGTEYTIEIIGNNGCVSQTTEIVKSGLPIVANNALSATQFTCVSGVPTAVLSFDVNQVSGGGTSYTWEFFNKTTGVSIGANNQPTVSVTDINGGTFFAVVTDASGGCATNTNEVTIVPTFTLTNVVATTVSQVTCLANERISARVSTAPNYVAGTELTFVAKRISDNFTITETYSSTVVASSVNHTFATLLPTGDYEITVTNGATQCQAKGTHQVADLSNKFEIAVSDEKQPSCYQGNDGAVTLTFIDKKPTVGGNLATQGFTYTVTHLASAQTTIGSVAVGTQTITLSNLNEGNYRVQAVSVVNGCSVEALFVVPQSPAQMMISATASPTEQVSCLTNQGSVSVAVTSGGKAPYSVTLTSPAQTATQNLLDNNAVLFNGLSVGVYTITVVDALGCSAFVGTQSVELKAPPAIVANVTISNISCHGQNDGRIEISNVSGGSGTNVFTYELISATDARPKQTSNVFENLKAGSYTVVIEDNMGCSTSTNTTIVEPSLISAKIDVTGSDRLVCYGQANGYVKVKAQGGTQPYAVDIYYADSNRRATPVSVMSPAPLNPVLAPEVEVLTDAILEPGTYYARVVDARGCAVTTTAFTVEEFPNIQPREVYQESDCRSNALYDPIVVRFTTDIDAANTYYILGGVRALFSRVEGSYGYIDNYDRTVATQTLTIEYTRSHSDGQQLDSCQSSMLTVDVQSIQPLTATEVANNNLNTIQVQASGGVAPYRYAFNNRYQDREATYILKNTDPGYVDSATGQIIKEIPVEVTDALGCTYTFTVKKVFYDVEMPNFFTPDGDGQNDVWKPRNLASYPKSKVYVYDRHGRLMTTLTASDAWGGIYEGSHMPSGDYWYVLELNDRNDTRRFYGNFTLYR